MTTANLERGVFVAPHNDDETLFGAFTLMRYDPLVVIVFDGYIQANRGLLVTADERRIETVLACRELGLSQPPLFLGLRDDQQIEEAELQYQLASLCCLNSSRTWAPAWEDGGHDQHNLVNRAARVARHLTCYLTYSKGRKSRNTSAGAREVTPAFPGDIARKHRALACYHSQLSFDSRMGCWPHFMEDLREYYVA